MKEHTAVLAAKQLAAGLRKDYCSFQDNDGKWQFEPVSFMLSDMGIRRYGLDCGTSMQIFEAVQNLKPRTQ